MYNRRRAGGCRRKIVYAVSMVLSSALLCTGKVTIHTLHFIINYERGILTLRAKKLYIMLLLFLLFCAMVIYLIYSKSQDKYEFSRLNGKIIVSNPTFKVNNGNGVLLFNPLSKNKEIIGNEKINHVIYFDENENMIASDERANIVQLNMKTANSKKGLSGIPTGAIGFAMRNHHNSVSYMIGNELMLLDISTLKTNTIRLPNIQSEKNFLAGYSWINEGESIVYSNGIEIFLYNIDTGDLRKLGIGRYPGFSPDSHYMFYSSSRDELIVKEISTGGQWTYKGEHIYPQFSPDNNFLAFQIQSKKSLSKGRDLIIWDYKAGKTITAIQDIGLDRSSQFVWIE
ncbi:hypothetical protein [Cohnella rhizosphaerae]|uniref:WD40 repeat domain-containing protein n=1 Tax=Cohnella rhizosphaerae TaxID=1457232 RepID=A0A9X4KTS9_9BACL|nr:hypothetical protein [Cohnella rhizosphaerae]MDG0810633.1 hypothetical protein [Cohnella rhizosphaerae]